MITVEQCASVWRNESVPAMLILLNGWLCYLYYHLLYHFSNNNVTTHGSGNGQILVNVLPCVQNCCKTGMSSGAHSPGHLVSGCSQGPILRPHFSQQFMLVTDYVPPGIAEKMDRVQQWHLHWYILCICSMTSILVFQWQIDMAAKMHFDHMMKTVWCSGCKTNIMLGGSQSGFWVLWELVKMVLPPVGQ